MKRLGRMLGKVVAAAVAVLALQAMAETNTAGLSFNHVATGFPLTGGHAAAACETCHVAGVFRGTARNCDGCHSLGKRVVATPKSTGHIVTDAPCDTCHFNASTFLGARYNHGTAQPGQCLTCHNGRLSMAKPASHAGNLNKSTKSCDQCHRSYTWLPASWNHIGVAPGNCATAGCHVQGSNQYFRGSTHTGYKLSDPACDDCHSYFAWSPAPYKHNSPAVCSSCHNGVTAAGKGPTHGSTTAECNTCHRNTTTWLGASYHNGAVTGICGTCHNGTNGVKGTINDPNGLHIPLTAGGDPNCDLCHRSTTTFTVYTMNHGGITTCNTCHSSTSAYVVRTKMTLGSHEDSTTAQDCSNCHTSTGTWSSALGSKPAKHIPEGTAPSCSSCHTGSSVLGGSALHAYLGGIGCYTCHGNNTVYSGQGQRTASWPNFHESSKNPSAADCSASGCHRPAGSKGSLYTNWD
ncbi:MAG: hypothetical protein HZB47_02455 [Nitrosomonadales bacterium]|nr:hypothetical protein [Nitrosomonadales bacterium]